MTPVRKTLLGLALIVGMMSAPAWSVEVSVKDKRRCLSVPAMEVHDILVNYSQYSKLPAATYKVSVKELLGFLNLESDQQSDQQDEKDLEQAMLEDVGPVDCSKASDSFGIALLSMSGSTVMREGLRPNTDGKGTGAMVRIELDPINVPDFSLHPNFKLFCESKIDPSRTSFTHTCDLRKDKAHFAVEDFHSTIQVRELPPGSECRTEFAYSFSYTSNDAEVHLVRDKVLDGAGSYKAGIAKRFKEKLFLTKYYLNFFRKMVEYVECRKPRG